MNLSNPVEQQCVFSMYFENERGGWEVEKKNLPAMRCCGLYMISYILCRFYSGRLIHEGTRPHLIASEGIED